METEIYLIRHGSIENPNRIVYGTLPGFHLSEEGRTQVAELASILKSNGIVFDAIYSGPLERTRETAQILINELGDAELVIRDELIDIKGNLQGNSLSVLENVGFDRSLLLENGYEIEDHKLIAERMGLVIDDIRSDHAGRRIAVVTHGDTSRILLWVFQHQDEPTPEKLRDKDYLETAEAVMLTFDENNQFVSYEHIRRT